MRSADILFLSRRCQGGVIKRANIIDVPDMAKAVGRSPITNVPRYLTGERQFGNSEPGLLGAAGKTLLGAGQAAASPLLGLFHAGGPGAGRQSGLGGMFTHGVNAATSALSGDFRGAGKDLTQLGRDVNPWNTGGAWSQAIQRHAHKGVQDVTGQIPHWWQFPGGFWDQAKQLRGGDRKNYGSTAL